MQSYTMRLDQPLTLLARGPTLDVTFKVDPRTERVKTYNSGRRPITQVFK